MKTKWGAALGIFLLALALGRVGERLLVNLGLDANTALTGAVVVAFLVGIILYSWFIPSEPPAK